MHKGSIISAERAIILFLFDNYKLYTHRQIDIEYWQQTQSLGHRVIIKVVRSMPFLYLHTSWTQHLEINHTNIRLMLLCATTYTVLTS